MVTIGHLKEMLFWAKLTNVQIHHSDCGASLVVAQTYHKKAWRFNPQTQNLCGWPTNKIKDLLLNCLD